MKGLKLQKNHISRFAIAQKRSDFNKTIIVQLVYVLRQVNPKKAKNLMSH